MRRPAARHPQSGVTLVEVISVLVLMVIVMVLLSEITIGALRVFEQSRTDDSMRTQAELTLQKLIPRLREVMTVNQLTSSLIDTYPPQKDAFGTNVVGYSGLQQGSRFKFFVGDDSGNASAAGTYLWQQQIVGNAQVLPTLLGSGFASCGFQAITSGGKTVGVRVTLAYAQTVMGTRTVSKSYVQEVTFRNV